MRTICFVAGQNSSLSGELHIDFRVPRDMWSEWWWVLKRGFLCTLAVMVNGGFLLDRPVLLSFSHSSYFWTDFDIYCNSIQYQKQLSYLCCPLLFIPVQVKRSVQIPLPERSHNVISILGYQRSRRLDRILHFSLHPTIYGHSCSLFVTFFWP